MGSLDAIRPQLNGFLDQVSRQADAVVAAAAKAVDEAPICHGWFDDLFNEDQCRALNDQLTTVQNEREYFGLELDNFRRRLAAPEWTPLETPDSWAQKIQARASALSQAAAQLGDDARSSGLSFESAVKSAMSQVVAALSAVAKAAGEVVGSAGAGIVQGLGLSGAIVVAVGLYFLFLRRAA